MKRFLFSTFMLAASLLPAAAQKQWSLSECIDYALEHNITVKQSALEVGQREIDLDNAKSSRLPGVSASGSQNFSFGRGLTADNTYANTNTTNTSLSIGASVPLFNGLKISNGIELSKLNLKAATADLEKIREDIKMAVAQAYVQILYDMEIAEVAAEQVRIDSLQVHRLEEMASIGKASTAEVAAQKASLGQSQLTAVQADNNLSLAVLDLTQLLELPSPEGFTVVKPGDGMLSIPLMTPDDIYAEAVGIKPVIRAEETRLEAADRNIKLAKGDYLPSLSLSGGLGTNYYTSSGYTSAKFFEQLGNNFSQYIGLSLNIPIFSRFSVRNGVKSAKITYDTQKLQLDNAKKSLYKDIQQAYYNALASDGKYNKSLSAVESAREAFSLTEAKYENGKANITEFDQSKTKYMSALSDLAQARYEYMYLRKILDFYRGVDLK
jgi:Outer membrane protein